MEYLSLGKITGSHGLDGTLKVYSTTNLQSIRYKKGNKVFLYNPENKEYSEHIVLNYKRSGLFDLVTLENISTIEDAISKKGQEICVIKSNNDLDKNSYFYSDLRGCKIIDKSGKEYGFVKEIEEFPAQIALRVVKGDNTQSFIPFIEQFILEVNIEKKYIVVNVIPGLL